MYPQNTDYKEMYALSDQTLISDLSSSVSITLPSNARGILVQPFVEDVHITFGNGDVTATTDHFRLSTAMVTPVFIPIAGGSKVAFIENLSGANLSYIVVR